jgi:predicted AlkP superfamily phosphohydrolase/phosphomutase
MRLGSRLSAWLAASSGAALASSLAIFLSAPALTRPLLPSILLVAVLPALAASLLVALIGGVPLLSRRGRMLSALAAALAASPWLAVAAAPISRFRAAAGLGAAMALWIGSMRAERRLLLALPALGAFGLLAAPRLGVIAPAGQRSCAVLGFDGATWTLVDRMIQAGELPHFAELVARGSAGILRSEPPTASPVVWTTIATGADPERHGVRNFGASRLDLQAGRVWDEITSAGLSAGIVGWLVNSPPDPNLRFSVPSWLDASDLSLPPAAGFAKRLELAAQGGRGQLSPSNPSLVLSVATLGLSALAVSSADNAWRLVRDFLWLLGRPEPEDISWRSRLFQARLQTDLYLELLARTRPEFSALVTYPSDSLGHLYWRYHEPQLFPSVTPEQIERHGQVVRDAYRTADYDLGKVVSRLDLSRTTVLVVSDHGMAALPESEGLRIDDTALLDWLEMRGELDASSISPSLVLTPKRTGPEGDVALARALAILEAATSEDHPASPPFEIERLPNQPRTLFVRLRRNDMDPSERIHIGARTVAARQLCTRETRSGQHTLSGVLLIAGPGVRPGTRLDAGLRDVAPTTLYSLGVPVPSALEGRVLVGAFSAAWLAEHPVARREGAMVPPPRPADLRVVPALESQLKELGYVK